MSADTDALHAPPWRLLQNRVRRTGCHTVFAETSEECISETSRLVGARFFLTLGEAAYRAQLRKHNLAPVKVSDQFYSLFDAFKAWLDGHGLRPFSTGKAFVLNIPHAPAHKLTAIAITPDGKNT